MLTAECQDRFLNSGLMVKNEFFTTTNQAHDYEQNDSSLSSTTYYTVLTSLQRTGRMTLALDNQPGILLI
jgi:hypothetical protein